MLKSTGNEGVKRLTNEGLALFNSVKRMLMLDCIEGKIRKLPSDGEILCEALHTLFNKKLNERRTQGGATK
jgi:hypothetical protein